MTLSRWPPFRCSSSRTRLAPPPQPSYTPPISKTIGLLSLLIAPECLEPLELMLIDDRPLLRLLVGFLNLREFLKEVSRLLLLFLKLLSNVHALPFYQQ